MTTLSGGSIAGIFNMPPYYHYYDYYYYYDHLPLQYYTKNLLAMQVPSILLLLPILLPPIHSGFYPCLRMHITIIMIIIIATVTIYHCNIILVVGVPTPTFCLSVVERGPAHSKPGGGSVA